MKLKPEQVPDEVVDALLNSDNVGNPWKFAIAGALNAWPGMQVWPKYDISLHDILILPLTTEARDSG